jgi:hypothetical protein
MAYDKFIKEPRRTSRKRSAEVAKQAKAKRDSIRTQLALYHRLRPRGGGPGAAVVTGAQIAGNTQSIMSGATAQEVLG